MVGIEEANINESTLDWVHRYFGTSKEELKQLNVTVNHSCQEIPSQTFDDSTLNKVSKNKVTPAKSLWSDEVDNMELIDDANNAQKFEQSE